MTMAMTLPTTPPGCEARRALLQSLAVAALLGAAGALPRAAQAAWNRAAFESRNLAEVARALGGAVPQASSELLLSGPDIAENGAVVPVSVSSRLPGIRRLLLLVEKNPTPLSAVFDLGDGIEPELQLNLKMARSSKVVLAAMMADARVLYTTREIGVTLGSCGA